MTTLEFRQAGESLYGEVWQPLFAKALGVNLRTLQRWANGQNEIPDGVADDVRQLLAIAQRRR